MSGTRCAASSGASGPHYKEEDAAALCVYMRQVSEYNTNAAALSRTKRNLARALNQDITRRQREMMLLYYVDRLTMADIGARLGVDVSTVSRTIRRGTERLRRVLRYGAEIFLDDGEEG